MNCLTFMPRKKTILNVEFPSHISARCVNKEWFHIPLPQVWTIMSDYLFFIHHAYEIRIFSFVLMRNHFHMIASNPKGNMSQAMNYFMRETSKRIGEGSGRINQVYGGPYHKTRIDSNHYFQTAYKYVYRNPVEAGLTKAPENYPYSTLYGILGKGALEIPVVEDTFLFDNPSNHISWLNRKYSEEDRASIQEALRRAVFRFPKDRTTRRPHRLENHLA
ncbi:MAG: transposase [Pseudobdellovibrionaceae bacterium]